MGFPRPFHRPATQTIIDGHEQALNTLPFDNKQDFDDASDGLIAELPHDRIRVPDPSDPTRYVTVWNNKAYDFLEAQNAPYTANPSLWRQSQLNNKGGLFEVVADKIYQVRGYDLANTTIIEGKSGVIIIDTLASKETGAAALKLYREHRGERPIKAIIYTHSHADHFGGIRGFVTDDEVGQEEGKVQILAPEGFLEHAVSENVYAGTAMSRRAAYMYGAALPHNPHCQIGAGLGQTLSTGSVTLIAPTKIIRRTGHREEIDGVHMKFQMAPDTEAPSEMLIYLEMDDTKALCAAEDAVHTFHNILTLRGAVVRDPHAWAKVLTETIDLWGREAQVLFASHHWPIKNTETQPNRIYDFLTCQRDLYAYVHDQTLRLLNKGLNGPEIAEQMSLPPAIENAWGARGYYGSLSHNVKAIYQRYMGWFDGNPAHLWEHIPVERARRYVELCGGIDQLVSKGQAAYNEGDFRWAAEILNHAVFADPNATSSATAVVNDSPDSDDDAEVDNAAATLPAPEESTTDPYRKARQLLAATYEQLGYGSENGPWRDFFMSGAYELRYGNFGTPTNTFAADVIGQMSPEMVFDSFAIQVKGPEAWDRQVTVDVEIKERARPLQPHYYRWWLSNGALVYTATTAEALQSASGGDDATAVAKITAEKESDLPYLLVYGLTSDQLVDHGIVIDDPSNVLGILAALLDPGDPGFNIVTP